MKRNKKEVACSYEHIQYLRKKKWRASCIRLLRFGLLIAIFGLWEVFARLGVIDAFITSSPSRIIKTVGNLLHSGDLMTHIGITLYETVLGFGISTLAGTAIAIILWCCDPLREILDPFIVVLNSLPKIALGPIIIIWCGTGMKAIVVMAILICIVITVLNMLSAFQSTDAERLLLLRSMGASKWQMLIKLVLPSSLPAFISVLKINVGMSWVGTIMGEYLVSRAGLGYLIVYGGQVFKLDLVMASTVILCILAAAMYFLVALIEKLTK